VALRQGRRESAPASGRPEPARFVGSRTEGPLQHAAKGRASTEATFNWKRTDHAALRQVIAARKRYAAIYQS
jgi:hypothetical protein